MRFTFEGIDYSFYFAYRKQEIVREIEARAAEVILSGSSPKDCGAIIGGGPGESVVLTLTQKSAITECHLCCLNPAGQWEQIKVLDAHSSPKDQFSFKIGREVALGRYMHDNPFVKYTSVKDQEGKHLRWEYDHGDAEKGWNFWGAMIEAWHRRFRTTVRERGEAGSV